MTTEQIPWDQRLAEVAHTYPSCRDSWVPALRDYELMGRMIRDLLRVSSSPGRRGQRPLPEVDAGMDELRRMWGDDYSTLPFPEAFSALTADRSLTPLVRKTGISRTKLQDLRRGKARPSGDDMEKIAAALKKTPAYFLEYRVGAVCAAIADHLRSAPEASIGAARSIGVYG